MRRKMKVPDLEVLNAWEQGVLQDGLGRAFPTRIRVLYTLYKKCNFNINLTSEYLRNYFPCFPCQNRNSLGRILKRFDAFEIAMTELQKDVETYRPYVDGCLDDEHLKRFLWKARRRIYTRCLPSELAGTLDSEEFD